MQLVTRSGMCACVKIVVEYFIMENVHVKWEMGDVIILEQTSMKWSF